MLGHPDGGAYPWGVPFEPGPGPFPGDNHLMPYEWYHMAVTFENTFPESFIEMYVNGWLARVNVFGEDIPQHHLTIGPFFFGTVGPVADAEGQPADVDFWNGMIDEVKIYDRKLSWEEVIFLSEDYAPKYVPLPDPTANVHSALSPGGFEIINFYDYSVIVDEPTWMGEFFYP